MITYFLASILLLALFYGIYISVLKDKNTNTWNRGYLLFSAVLMIMLPLIRIPQPTAMSAATALPYLPTTAYSTYRTAIQTHPIDISAGFRFVYAMGLFWGISRLLLGTWILHRIRRTAHAEQQQGYTLYYSRDITTPFSFLSAVYLPEACKSSTSLPTLLAHEAAHCQRKHSWDKLFISILQSIFWFNPFVYLYHRELERVHEFEADAIAAKHFDTDTYVNELMQIVVQQQTPTFLAHSFFHQNLKTRITMLYKTHTHAISRKMLVGITVCTLSAAFVVTQSYAKKKKSTPDPKTTQVMIQNPNAEQQPIAVSVVGQTPDSLLSLRDVDQEPSFVGGESALHTFIENHKAKLNVNDRPEKAVWVQFTVHSNGQIDPKLGIDPYLNNAAVEKNLKEIFAQMPTWTPGKRKGKSLPVIMDMSIKY
jgi:hypothetical protein